MSSQISLFQFRRSHQTQLSHFRHVPQEHDHEIECFALSVCSIHHFYGEAHRSPVIMGGGEKQTFFIAIVSFALGLIHRRAGVFNVLLLPFNGDEKAIK